MRVKQVTIPHTMETRVMARMMMTGTMPPSEPYILKLPYQSPRTG